MTTVAFIGLGIMGGPMAANLVKAGFEVAGYNRSPEPVKRLVDAGGRGAESVADAVRGADVIVTMVPDSPDVEDVTGGDDGVFANAEKGAIHVDMSTIRPDVAVRVAEAGRTAGLRVLDAPVSGGEAGAIEGSLSIMVGGEAADFEAAKPVLEAVGKTIVHVGAAGSGQAGTIVFPTGSSTGFSSPATSSCSPRRWCSSRPTAWTPRPRWRCSAGASPAAPC